MQPVFISIQIRAVLIRTDMHTSKTYQCCTSASALYVLTLKLFSSEWQHNTFLEGRGDYQIIAIENITKHIHKYKIININHEISSYNLAWSLKLSDPGKVTQWASRALKIQICADVKYGNDYQHTQLICTRFIPDNIKVYYPKQHRNYHYLLIQ